MDTTRVDKWLWAVRIYKTRSASTTACQGGHVTVNGIAAKPSTKVVVGDLVASRVHDRDRLLEVTRIIDKRVGASVAADCLIDQSPPPPPAVFVAPAGIRDPGSGRPTKRDRRTLDRYLGK